MSGRKVGSTWVAKSLSSASSLWYCKSSAGSSVVHRARTLLEVIKARAVPWGLCRTLLALSQMAGALAVSSSSSMPKKRSSSRWDQW